MKKVFASALSLLCIVALVVAMAVPAMATDKTNEDPIVVTCIGDSISGGCALFRDTELPENNDYWGVTLNAYDYYLLSIGSAYDSFFNNYLRQDGKTGYEKIDAAFGERMLSAYPIQVAMKLNGVSTDDLLDGKIAENLLDKTDYRCLTCNAMSSIDFRKLLQSDYVAPEGSATLGMTSMLGFTSDAVAAGMTGSDLLLYHLGGNDTLSVATFQSLGSEEISLESMLETLTINIAAYKENTEYILNTYLTNNPGASAVLIGLYDPLLDNDLTTYLDSTVDSNLYHLVDYANPQSIMGMIYQSFASTIKSVDNDTAKALGNAIELALAQMNSFLRELADRYDNTYYVDVNGVSTRYEETGGEYVKLSGDGFHPSTEGHDYITRRVLSVLPDKFVAHGRYDITIDLGNTCSANGKVTAVAVNNKAYYDYEQNGRSLTIHYNGTDATTVLVTTQDGKNYGISTWQCAWNHSDGYRTYPLVNVSNTAKLVTTVADKVKTSVLSLASKLKGFAKK